MRVVKRVLIADDNSDIADCLGFLVEMMGHQAAVTYGGRQAIEEYQRFRPDLVILDINMPDVTGYDAARAIRDLQTGSTVIVACTGASDVETAAKARRNGFDRHYTKPMSETDIEALLAMEQP